ncbi:MAG: 4,5-dioxygenase [Proteobacteria bacterium]|nr:4,5-dioxygenase [Pseudomonadota bacterium]
MTRPISDITGYHAHIYFRNEAEKQTALALRDVLGQLADARLGRVHERPVGPHPVGMYQVAFPPHLFPHIVPLLMLNRAGLSVLVHPETGDDLSDHTIHPLWLGEPLPLNTDIFE